MRVVGRKRAGGRLDRGDGSAQTGSSVRKWRGVIQRASGLKVLPDEDAIYAEELAALTAAGEGRSA
jgi:hypothetical protein